jgi:thiol-disulfide isomerase/thioredoxin
MIRISLLILTLTFLSCTNESGNKNQVETSVDSKTTSNDVASIEVPLISAADFQPLIDNYRGKILFINLWATWCVPCKEEFPDLVRLDEYYANSDVVIIGISVDFPDEVESKIKPFLHSQKVKFPNFVQNFKDPLELINLLNENWRGAVPTTFIYDKEGKQQKYLLGKHSFEQFKSEIESIRKES